MYLKDHFTPSPRILFSWAAIDNIYHNLTVTEILIKINETLSHMLYV